MENKNIMLVIASVSLFFVVVVGVGLWLFWPKDTAAKGAESAAARPLFDKEFDSFEFYRTEQELPGLLEEEKKEEGKAKELTLTVGEAEEKMTIEKKEEGVKAIPQTERVAAKTQAVPRVEKKAEGVPSRTAKRTAVVTKKETTPRRTPRKVYVKEYEIQVGSYKTRTRAESINEKLQELGLTGSIRTRQIGGVTYYRVRIGPYSSQGEAAKFLTWLRDVEGLEDSYISQVTRQKTVN
jgi:DedD protein